MTAENPVGQAQRPESGVTEPVEVSWLTSGTNRCGVNSLRNSADGRDESRPYIGLNAIVQFIALNGIARPFDLNRQA